MTTISVSLITANSFGAPSDRHQGDCLSVDVVNGPVAYRWQRTLVARAALDTANVHDFAGTMGV